VRGSVGGLCNSSLELTGVAGDPTSRIHRLDPRAKLLGFIGLTVVAVTTPLSVWPVWIACGLGLAVVAAVARIGPGTVWRRARLILPLVLFVGAFVPFARAGEVVASLGPFDITREGLETWASASVKATIGTVSAVLLAATTAYPQVLRGLEALRVPRTLTLIAAFMYRYLFVIVDEVQRMRAARDARGYRPRTMFGAGAVGRVASALFLRTHARGERVYLAMLSRGYDGRMRHLVPLSFGRADAAFVTLVALLLLPLRVIA
jgi:cobalt/nickel transport system permease protein